jgi:hypothetical protein
MEPVTALAVAGNVLQFVQFAGTLFTSTRKIYAHPLGNSAETAHLDYICGKLTDFSSHLNSSSSSSTHTLTRQSQHERAIAECTVLCQRDCESLLTITSKLRAKNSSSKMSRSWSSFKVAIAEVVKACEIETLRLRIQDQERILLLNICAMSRFVLKIFGSWLLSFGPITCNSMHADPIFMKCSENVNRLRAQLETFEAIWQGANETKHKELLRGLEDVRKRVQSLAQVASSGSAADDIHLISADLSKLSLGAHQYGKEGRIVASLNYDERPLRHDVIPSAHRVTFAWALNGLKDAETGQEFGTLRRWLCEDGGLFWVSGKPGSGKSTFMKFVADNFETARLLRAWSRQRNLLIAAHYFTIYGSPIQRSLEGLLRSLLYSILTREPRLISRLLPDRLTGQFEQHKWTQGELESVLRRVAAERAPDINMCFFIDGLDEYTGEHLEICQTLAELSQSSSIKICVSSRPWNVFEDAFGGRSDRKLYMQHLTQKDISKYTAAVLCRHPRWQALVSESSQSVADSLIAEVVAKSSGVFLWVTLVTRRLQEGLTNDDSIQDLQRRLASFPSDLDPFFRHMLDSVDPFYQDRMARTLLFALHAKSPMKWVRYFFHDLEYDDGDYALYEPGTPITALAYEPRRAQTEQAVFRRINGRCKGLLERNGDRVEFLHRTVLDFLSTQQMKGLLRERAQEGFCPTLSLFRASIACIKQTYFRYSPIPENTLINPLEGMSGFVNCLLDAFHYAFESDVPGGSAARLTAALLDNMDASIASMIHSGLISGLSLPMASNLYRSLVLEVKIKGYLLTKLPEPGYFDGDLFLQIRRQTPLSFILFSSPSAPPQPWVIRAIVDSGYSPNDPIPGSLADSHSHWARYIDTWTPPITGGSAANVTMFKSALEHGVFLSLLQKGADPNALVHIDRDVSVSKVPAWLKFLMLAVYLPLTKGTWQSEDGEVVSLDDTTHIRAYRATLTLALRGSKPGLFSPGFRATRCVLPFCYIPMTSEAKYFVVRVFADALTRIGSRDVNGARETRNWLVPALPADMSTLLREVCRSMEQTGDQLPSRRGKRDREDGMEDRRTRKRR